jgi:methionyl-tRNA synthetase
MNKQRQTSDGEKNAFYLTTTLPYVNAEPHIGFALEVVHADIAARYHKLLGEEIFFNTGTDEHGTKIYRKALEEGKEPQKYVDEYAEKFKQLKERLNLSQDLRFIRTTDVHHKEAVQEFWRRCLKNDDIYKKNYTTKYCVGCELEKTESELVNGACSIHQNLKIELIDEENYFFRFSKYRDRLLEMYENRPDFVTPDYRFNEIRRFVEGGLQDFSISRLAKKMPWGVPVPGDQDHVMYVWFDALINYVSTLGWPEDEVSFRKFWGTNEKPNAIQVAGKDQIRQQAAMWQAMLMSAGLPPSRKIFIHGFINVGGQKMSKSLGNVINPYEIVEEYGTDALRYFLARHIHPFEDSDFTMEKFKIAYNADLANGLGNAVARIMTLAEKHLNEPVKGLVEGFQTDFKDRMDKYEFGEAIAHVTAYIVALDGLITEKEPFKVIKSNPEKAKADIAGGVHMLWSLNYHLQPFMPETSRKIRDAVLANKKPENLFPRKE